MVPLSWRALAPPVVALPARAPFLTVTVSEALLEGSARATAPASVLVLALVLALAWALAWARAWARE